MQYGSLNFRSTLPLRTLLQKIKSEREAEGLSLSEADVITLMESIQITAVDTTMPEDASRYVFHPDAYVLRNFWDPLMRVLACFFFLEVPFAIAYHPEKAIGTAAPLLLRVLSPRPCTHV